MHQITYISTAQPGTTGRTVETILATSRRNNNRDGITGLLVSDGTRFLQVLEGDKPAVEAAYTRIKADPRHRASVVLSSKPIVERQFGSWDMAFSGFSNGNSDAALAEMVDRLVNDVGDPNISALFSSFARINRSQAA